MKLGPRYRFVTEIAAGGMGAIVLAVRLEADGTKTPVAIKQLHAHLANDPEVVASFVDEARIASQIVHPHVVRVEDVEMIGNEVVLVMEYVEGVSFSVILKALRSQEMPLPLPVARRVLHDGLLGLHAAHEQKDASGAPLNVVHRDVSPHNILVGVNGIARVADFGIAMATGRVASTRTGGGVKGKLQYLSPEQINRKPVDRRTDIFAAGTILWECLAGRRLFSAATEGETLAMVLRGQIEPPSTFRPDVPLDLDEACLQALERDPARRFGTAEDFAAALTSGELASREEVATLVARVAPSTIAARRALVEQALRSTHFTPIEPMLAAEPAATRSADSNASPSRPSPLSRAPLLLALLVGLVAGGVGVGIAARRTSAPAVPMPEVSAPAPTTSAPSEPVASSITPPAASAAAVTHAPATSSSVKRTSAKKPAGSRTFMPDDL